MERVFPAISSTRFVTSLVSGSARKAIADKTRYVLLGRASWRPLTTISSSIALRSSIPRSFCLCVLLHRADHITIRCPKLFVRSRLRADTLAVRVDGRCCRDIPPTRLRHTQPGHSACEQRGHALPRTRNSRVFPPRRPCNRGETAASNRAPPPFLDPRAAPPQAG